MDDVSTREIVLKVTATVKEDVIRTLQDNGIDFKKFITSVRDKHKSMHVTSSGSSYQLTGSYECIKDTRAALGGKLAEILANGKKTSKTRQGFGVDDVRSLETLKVSPKDGGKNFDGLSSEAKELEKVEKPKRVRKLKAVTTPEIQTVPLPAAIAISSSSSVPSASAADVPAAAHVDLVAAVPAAVHADVPATVHADVPSAGAADVPAAAHVDLVAAVPAAAHVDLVAAVPAAVHLDIPATVHADVPSAAAADVPTAAACVPGPIHADVPAATSDLNLPASERCFSASTSTGSSNATVHVDRPFVEEDQNSTEPHKSLATSGSLTDEEVQKRIKSGAYVSIDVDKDHHDHLMKHFGDDLKQDIPLIHSYQEGGKHKVALGANYRTRRDKDKVADKYNIYLKNLHMESYPLPDSADASVVESVAASTGTKRLSFQFDMDQKICRIIGSKADVESMKQHLDEQMNFPVKPEHQWTKQSSKSKMKKSSKEPEMTFAAADGKVYQSSLLAEALPSLKVKVMEWKKEKSAPDAVVFAIDGKMRRYKDARAINFTDDKRYTQECNKVLNQSHNNLPLLEMLHTDATEDLKKQKMKSIIHVVLAKDFGKTGPTNTVTADQLKDALHHCLVYADQTLKVKSVAIPHLCPGLFGMDLFIRSAVGALQVFTGKGLPKCLRSVNLVGKDKNMTKDMMEHLQSCCTNKP